MVDRPNPGEGITGGEGKQEWELQRSKAHLWVALELEMRAGDGGSTASGGLRARSTAAGWLRWDSGEGKWPGSCARPRRCSLGGQSGRRSGGEAAPRRRQACRRTGWSGGGVLRRGSEERAKERGESVSGVFVVLGRTRGEGGGLCSGLATATARWRPAGCSGRRGKARRHQRGQRRAVGSSRATRGIQRDAERGRAASPRRRRHCTVAAAGETERIAGGGRKRTRLQFPKIPGTTL